jgi:hypothetical protein
MKPALIIVEGKMRPYERHQAIFLLQSPVYDSNFTKQDHIIYEWSTQIDGGAYGDEPVFHTESPNNLFWFDRYINELYQETKINLPSDTPDLGLDSLNMERRLICYNSLA